MKRQVMVALVSVAALAVLILAVPLGLQAYRLDVAETELLLERDAALVARAVPVTFDSSPTPVVLPLLSRDRTVTLYDDDGVRIQGPGPATGDALVDQALVGSTVRGFVGPDFVVALPLTSDTEIVGAVRVAVPADILQRDTAATVALIVAAALIALGVASLVAWRLAVALTEPVTNLADTADRLGAGDFTARVGTTRFPEINRAGESLNDAAQRIATLVERERHFTADVSHQLGTALTRLRILLDDDRPDQKTVVDGEISRMTATLEHLMTLARGDAASRVVVDVTTLAADARARWDPAATNAGRRLDVRGAPAMTLAASAAVDQILDVLIDNALQHGQGHVRVAVRAIGGAVAVDVSNEGPAIDDDADLFVGHSSKAGGHGIGLALARRLAEAEGGRLTLSRRQPGATFTLLLPPAG